ncbi:MAG: 30S ribosomal protein S16 [Bacilli bacterium]
MVKIRLTRTGRHFNPTYRMVVADSRYARDGRFIEQVGFYDPMTDEIKLDEEKIMSWLNKGAQVSDTVKSILSKHGIIAKFAASKK